MSKQNYAVCCYTCEHNGQETCKGCNTILNGENEPYENWRLREDLCQKDKQITELQKQLEEKEKDNQFLKKMYLLERTKNDNYRTEKYGLDKPVEELRKIKLSPKEKEIYYKGFDNCERQFASHIVELQQQLKQSIKENSENLQQLYSYLGVEAFGEDIQEQAVKEIDKLKQSQKQVGKEVVEEIRERLKKAHLEIMSSIDLYSYIDNFLYQVEKEIKGK